MAGTIKLNASVEITPEIGNTLSLGVVDRIRSLTADGWLHHVQQIGTSEEAITLGDVTDIREAMFINLDPTNYIELRVATGGAKFARLDPDTNQDGTGGFALLSRMGAGAQVPYAIADTGACNMLVLLKKA